MKLALISVSFSASLPLTALPAPSRFLSRPQLLTSVEPRPMGRDSFPSQNC